MADASNNSSFLNPWLLHHQKLGLELKCPLWYTLSLSLLIYCIWVMTNLVGPLNLWFFQPKSAQPATAAPLQSHLLRVRFLFSLLNVPLTILLSLSLWFSIVWFWLCYILWSDFKFFETLISVSAYRDLPSLDRSAPSANNSTLNLVRDAINL